MSSGQTSALNSFLSGGFGGMCLVAAGHPLDLIKVNLQTMPRPKAGEAPLYTGMVDCAKKIIAKDGVTGLYRGMSAPMVGISPIFAICFWGYKEGDNLARWWSKKGPNEPLTMGEIMFAGGFSAVPTTAIMAPGERIKCLLQVQAQEVERGGKIKYNGMVDCGKQLFKEGGIASVYRGTAATLLRDVPGSIAYFGAYEAIKIALTPQGGDPSKLNAGAVLVAGGCAGIANWTVAIPPDTLKSRLQTAPEGTYKGLVDVFRKLVAEEGLGALFKGLGPAMTRAFPANAACFLGVETSRKALHAIGLH